MRQAAWAVHVALHSKGGVANSVGALWWFGGAWGLVGFLFVVVVWLGVTRYMLAGGASSLSLAPSVKNLAL